MNHFFFGTAERRLFGVYEPAANSRGESRAAILCYPWAAEYTFAHRTMRRLAMKMASAGFHTLRFDYYGTGDSGGEPTDTDIIGWQADLESAIEELNEITGLTRVTLVGMRLGGVVAAAVASRLRNRVETVVLWDPIISGLDYLKQLGMATNDGPPYEVQGFPATERWIRDLSEIDLISSLSKSQSRTLVVVTDDSSSHGQLMSSLAGKEAISIEHHTDARPWMESSVESGLFPSSVLRRIMNWLDET